MDNVDIEIEYFDIEETKIIALQEYKKNFPSSNIKQFDEYKINKVLFNYIFFRTVDKYINLIKGYSNTYKVPLNFVRDVFKDKFIYLVQKKYPILEGTCRGFYGS